jgi:hypothetical protein
VRAHNVFGSVSTTTRDTALITGHSLATMAGPGTGPTGQRIPAETISMHSEVYSRNNGVDTDDKGGNRLGNAKNDSKYNDLDVVEEEEEHEHEHEHEHGNGDEPHEKPHEDEDEEDEEDEDEDEDMQIHHEQQEQHSTHAERLAPPKPTGVSSDKDLRLLEGAINLQEPSTTGQFDEDEESLRNLDNDAATMAHNYITPASSPPSRSTSFRSEGVEHAPAGVALRATIDRDLSRRVEQYVLSPHTLTVFMISNPYFHKHTPLSEDEAIERLGLRQIAPELLPAISERDPMCVMHGITLPEHDHIGATISGHKLVDGTDEVMRKRRPPRVVAVIGCDNAEQYYRVVKHTPGSNDLTRMIDTPTRTAGQDRRFSFLTARHI